MATLTTITAEDWSRADPVTKARVNEIVAGLEKGDFTPPKLAGELRALVMAAVDHEREEIAKLVHDRLGADGYGVAQMIRKRGETQ